MSGVGKKGTRRGRKEGDETDREGKMEGEEKKRMVREVAKKKKRKRGGKVGESVEVKGELV